MLSFVVHGFGAGVELVYEQVVLTIRRKWKA